MAEQNFQNHTRLDPLFHFAIIPVLLAHFVVAVVRSIERPSAWHLWSIAVALVLVALAIRMRTYALQVQDRVILLEERIRMAALMPLEARQLQRELTRGQIIALRFSSDAELADLAELAVREKLSPKQIKERIASWRADHHRV